MTAATAEEATRMAWGRALRAEREARRLTQAEVAALADLDQASVSRAEGGTGSFGTYLRIAGRLGVALEAAL